MYFTDLALSSSWFLKERKLKSWHAAHYLLTVIDYMVNTVKLLSAQQAAIPLWAQEEQKAELEERGVLDLHLQAGREHRSKSRRTLSLHDRVCK